ncbi:hypothetical protein [Streptomyces sp. VRA16 Mangrove soil]|uniref:hypothetical protein n=1 Tax=Streptomyces sp. VRA16 Mangrove soil TaxID=2817434 RepID=UPI001A9DEB0A|nr:hypothetical protein [Streptomyces sp. VRA16 Mangrove soil]MBO1334692.1 hypothetical protein [Streptomyces sp. VRA16 Mangrove soil]
MSWQHPHEGGDPAIPGVVYDPQQSARSYDGYADPAAAHGWNDAVVPDPHAYPDAYDTAPLEPIPDGSAYGPGPEREPEREPEPERDDDGAVFVDGSGRRRRLMRRGGIAAGAVCVVFLGVVVAGLFGSSPSGGPLPWSDGQDEHKQPRAEHSAPASPSPGATGGAATPSTTPSASDSADTEKQTEKDASPTSSATQSTGTKAPTTTAPATTAPARGNSDNNPGRGNGSPGATKGPK